MSSWRKSMVTSLRSALSLAMESAASEMSIAVTSVAGQALAMAQAMHPLPVQMSAADFGVGERVLISWSVHSSVSGRGMSTSDVTLISHPQ